MFFIIQDIFPFIDYILKLNFTVPLDAAPLITLILSAFMVIDNKKIVSSSLQPKLPLQNLAGLSQNEVRISDTGTYM